SHRKASPCVAHRYVGRGTCPSALVGGALRRSRAPGAGCDGCGRKKHVVDKDTRNAIERATQRARRLLEEDFAAQLEGDFDVHRDGAVAAKPGPHLTPRQAFQRERIVAAIEHKRAAGMNAADAARDYLRDAAFTT